MPRRSALARRASRPGCLSAVRRRAARTAPRCSRALIVDLRAEQPRDHQQRTHLIWLRFQRTRCARVLRVNPAMFRANNNVAPPTGTPASVKMPERNQMDDLSQFLRPAGGGIHTVSTGRAEREALQQALYDARDEAEVQAQVARGAGVDRRRARGDARHPVRLRRGAGARRGVRARGACARRCCGACPISRARGARRDRRRRRRLRACRSSCTDDMLSDEQRRRTRAALYGPAAAATPIWPVAPLSIAERVVDRAAARATRAAHLHARRRSLGRLAGGGGARRGTRPSRGRSFTPTRTPICCPSGWACGSASPPGPTTPTSCSGGAGGWCRSACAPRRARSSTGSRRWACGSSGPTRCARAATRVIDDVIAHLHGAGRAARLSVERHRRHRRAARAVDRRARAGRPVARLRARADRAGRRGVSAARRRRRRGRAADRQRRGRAADRRRRALRTCSTRSRRWRTRPTRLVG